MKQRTPAFSLISIVFLLTSAGPVGAANQVLLRYADIGPSGSTRAMAVDKSGNIFLVSNSTDLEGNAAIRVNKLDFTGNALATLNFGGTSANPTAAAVDASGNLIVVGQANSSTFTTVNALFPGVAGSSAFIAKIDSQLNGVTFSTLVASPSTASAVTTDSMGNIYVAGSTTSNSFPSTASAYRTTAPGAFLLKISPAGSQLLLAIQFGGSQVTCSVRFPCTAPTVETLATAVTLDVTGSILLAGNTTAVDLPVTSGVVQGTCGCTYQGDVGFAAKFSSDGSQLIWSTFLGKSAYALHSVSVDSMAVDPAGDVILGGVTPGSDNFSGFITKLNAAATQMLWNTSIGGAGYASLVSAGVYGLAVSSDGRIAFTGSSDPGLLPVVPGVTAFGSAYSGWLSADGSTVNALYVGGDFSSGLGVALNTTGNLVTAGRAGSIWIETAGSWPSLFFTDNSASGPVSGAVSPYELISFYGAGIGPQTGVSGTLTADGTAFTKSLNGYSVTFDGIAAPLLYVGATQINAIVPSAVTGKTHARIVTPNGTVDGPTFLVQPPQPYMFQNFASGLLGVAAALNQNGSVNTLQNPAKPGSIVTVYVSGAATDTSRPDGYIVPVNSPKQSMQPVSVIAGGTSLEVDYAGDAPTLVAGVMQVNFRLPSGYISSGLGNPGPYIPVTVQVQVGGTIGGSATVFMAPQ